MSNIELYDNHTVHFVTYFYSSSEAFDDCRYSCFELFLCHVLEPDGEIILTDIESIKSL